MTLKGESLGPEFRALLNRAAAASDETQGWAVRVMTAEAQRVLRGDPAEVRQDAPPLPAVVVDRLDAQAQQLADLAAKVEALTQAQRGRLWARLRAALEGVGRGPFHGQLIRASLPTGWLLVIPASSRCAAAAARRRGSITCASRASVSGASDLPNGHATSRQSALSSFSASSVRNPSALTKCPAQTSCVERVR